MRFTVARPYERGTPGYAPRATKAHAVEVDTGGLVARRTMCGLVEAELRIVKADGSQRADWLDVTIGRCARCTRAIERRIASGDEMERLA